MAGLKKGLKVKSLLYNGVNFDLNNIFKYLVYRTLLDEEMLA
jgi:hypothetical protein